MGFPRQEYWSGLPLLSLGDLSDPEIDPCLLNSKWSPVLQVDSLPTVPPGKPWLQAYLTLYCTSLYSASPRLFSFHKLKVCSKPALRKSMAPLFYSSICSLCVHFFTLWGFFQCSNIIHYCYICYGDLWSLIFEVTIVSSLGHHEDS